MSDTLLAISDQQIAESFPEGTLQSEQGSALPFARVAAWIGCDLSTVYKWAEQDGLEVVKALNDRTGRGNRRNSDCLLLEAMRPYKERFERDQRDGSYAVPQGDAANANLEKRANTSKAEKISGGAIRATHGVDYSRKGSRI